MKFKKKTAMILSFALGTVMFATTAMAEVVSKSGYDQLKDSLKYTAESCTSKLSNYTVDMSFVVKHNGTIISSESTLGKYDVSKNTRENVSTTLNGSNKRENYYYSDKNCFINKEGDQNIYYVTEYTSPNEDRGFENPFKKKEAGDIERIADALVGNLKDSVVVTQNANGSKELSGSLNESQIPALINAVVSLQSRSQFNRQPDDRNQMPKITKDIFVKEIKGKMIVNKDGLIESVLGTGVLSGKDESGKEHTLSFELLGKLSNINSTNVKKPNLSGKKVEKTVEKNYDKISNPEKYIGKYKTDIIIEKDNQLQKIGEKFIDIEKFDGKNISGRYHEEFVKGYEEYAANKKDFKFTGEFKEKDHFNGSFTSTNSAGNKFSGNIYVNIHSAKINFNINESNNRSFLHEDSFNRVFN